MESLFTSLAESSSHCLADVALVMVSSVVKVCSARNTSSTPLQKKHDTFATGG